MKPTFFSISSISSYSQFTSISVNIYIFIRQKAEETSEKKQQTHNDIIIFVAIVHVSHRPHTTPLTEIHFHSTADFWYPANCRHRFFLTFSAIS